MSGRALKYDPEDPYGFVEYLMEGGVPVFQMQAPRETEKQGKEFARPNGWQNQMLSQRELKNVRNLYRDRPRAALERGWGAVTGVIFDVIDVDFHLGGLDSWKKMKELGVMPPVYGWYRTPSLGWHLYVPRSGLRTKHKVREFEGIDFQMGGDVPDERGSLGRAYVYTCPTLKYGKLADGGFTEQLGSYVLGAGVDLDLLREGQEWPGMPAWQEWLEGVAGAVREPVPLEVAPVWEGDQTDAGRRYLQKALRSAYEEIVAAPKGTSWAVFCRRAYGLGRLVTGFGLDRREAEELLRIAGRYRRVGELELQLGRSFGNGMKVPYAPPVDSSYALGQAGDDYANEQDQIISEFLGGNGG